MLKHIALGLLFAEQLIPLPTIEDYEFGNAGHKVECKGKSQPDLACALVFNVDPPVPDGIASVSGSEYDLIRGIMLRLDGTLYTTVFDPPLKKKNGFFGLEKGTGILARVNGDYLLVRWPNGKEAKAKIIRREKINPNRPSLRKNSERRQRQFPKNQAKLTRPFFRRSHPRPSPPVRRSYPRQTCGLDVAASPPA